jgi:hypothetical protein
MNHKLMPIAPRLRKLLLMLSSSHDGEVVAAARKIERLLHDGSHDWHDLAEALFPSETQPDAGDRRSEAESGDRGSEAESGDLWMEDDDLWIEEESDDLWMEAE